jgi:hypothetical protein
MIMLFFINAAAGGEVWFIYPWLGMMIGMGMHALTAWQGGMRLTDVFRSPSSLRAREVAAGPPDPAYAGEMRALGLVRRRRARGIARWRCAPRRGRRTRGRGHSHRARAE